jgi:hypothetical protein|tara:strand:+ start:25 stop:384 length:360 start_codon:yes stop_codon:yes gene_type:complete
MAVEIEWTKGYRGTKIVTLPDGSKITSKTIAEKVGLTKFMGIGRLNAYLKDGDLEALWRKKGSKKAESNGVKKEVVEPIKNIAIEFKVLEPVEIINTHYEEGDLRHYYDPDWKLVMQNI